MKIDDNINMPSILEIFMKVEDKLLINKGKVSSKNMLLLEMA